MGPLLCDRLTLKLQLKAELHLSCPACAIDSPERIEAERSTRKVEIYVIEKVEELGTELKPVTLADGRVFTDTEVPVPEPRTDKDVATGIAEGKGIGRPSKRIGVKPSVDGWMLELAVANAVGPIAAKADVGWVCGK